MQIISFQAFHSGGLTGSNKYYIPNPAMNKVLVNAEAETDEEKYTSYQLSYIGEYNGRSYYAAPDEYVQLEQPEEIQCETKAELSTEEKAYFLQHGTLTQYKNNVRQAIERSVGDDKDLLADQSKLIEFAIVGLCAMLADYTGVQPMDEETKQVYGARAKAVLDAISNGSLKLRASFVDPNSTILEVLPRWSKVQECVESYIENKRQLGL